MKITDKLLTPNKYSRPCTKRKTTTKIAVHYVGNPNTTALNNRNYFENLRFQKSENDNTTNRWVSSHYLVGLDGEIIRCVPDDEIAYTTNQANAFSIGIETCHPNADGIFTDSTYIALCELCAMLLKKYNLTTNDLIRHYDVTQKQCPLHWSPTKYQSEALATARWNKFKEDVYKVMTSGELPKNNNTVNIKVSNNTSTTSTTTTKTNEKTTVGFKIKVLDSTLNVRKDAGTNYAVVCTIKKNEIYTIIATKKVGMVTWGKLKSGIGWVSLNSKYVQKI